jgi:hypothetical protein
MKINDKDPEKKQGDKELEPTKEEPKTLEIKVSESIHLRSVGPGKK